MWYILILIVLNEIPLMLVGYEMIIANPALRASLAIYRLIPNARLLSNSLLLIIMFCRFSAKNGSQKYVNIIHCGHIYLGFNKIEDSR